MYLAEIRKTVREDYRISRRQKQRIWELQYMCILRLTTTICLAPPSSCVHPVPYILQGSHSLSRWGEPRYVIIGFRIKYTILYPQHTHALRCITIFITKKKKNGFLLFCLPRPHWLYPTPPNPHDEVTLPCGLSDSDLPSYRWKLLFLDFSLRRLMQNLDVIDPFLNIFPFVEGTGNSDKVLLIFYFNFYCWCWLNIHQLFTPHVFVPPSPNMHTTVIHTLLDIPEILWKQKACRL